MTWLGVFGGAILWLVVLKLVQSKRRNTRTREMAASRDGENFDTFYSGFEPETVPLQELRAVYRIFQDVHAGVVENFPIRATDEIGVFVVAGNCTDLVQNALAACGKQLPPQAMLDTPVSILTVRDFALFVAACPPAENANPC